MHVHILNIESMKQKKIGGESWRATAPSPLPKLAPLDLSWKNLDDDDDDMSVNVHGGLFFLMAASGVLTICWMWRLWL